MTDRRQDHKKSADGAAADGLLMDRLRAYAAKDVLPMHMPGHKRNTARYPWLADLSADLDITEIHDFDDIVEVDCFPDVTSFLCVNGSTGALLAAVRTAVGPGDELILARNCHKAVYHAAELCGARVRYLLPNWDGAWGVYGRVQPAALKAMLEEGGPSADGAADGAAYAHRPASAAHGGKGARPAAVVITSPTYEGDVSDVAALAALCHARGIPLIVDEAHGAHFSLPGFPDSAVLCGADVVVQSLHKTLPSPTQTAVVHIRSALLSAEELRRQLLLFQTSSPSFLLMAAAQKALAYVRENGAAEAADWLARIRTLKESVWPNDRLQLRQTDDPSKLLVGCALPGRRLMDGLRERFGIEAEMEENHAVLFMTGMGDTDKAMKRLARALRAEAAQLPKTAPLCYEEPQLPPKMLEACEAVRRPKALTPLAGAAGRVCAEYVWAYPPGIPFLVPGERVTPDAVQKAVAIGRKALYTLM